MFKFATIFYIVIGIITGRVFLELNLFVYPKEIDPFQDIARFYLENMYYFLIVFLTMVFVLGRCLKIEIREVANFAVRMFSVILLPPLIDYFLVGRREGYDYASVEHMMSNFSNLSFIKGDATLGISVEILIALLCIFFYSFKKSKNIWKALGVTVLLDMLLVFISTPEIFFQGGRDDYYYDHFLPAYYFFPFIFLVSIFYAFVHKDKFKALIGNIRIVRSLVFICAVLVGGAISFATTKEFYIWNLSLGSVAIFFVWQVSVLLNDIYDIEIDRITNSQRPLVTGVCSIVEYRFISVLFSFWAISFAAVITWQVFILTLITLIFAICYSVPPFRLRKNFMGNIIIGLSLMLSMHAGLYCASYGYPAELIIFSKHGLMLSVVMFLLGCVISTVKDIKDIKSDKAHGISNCFTVFGKTKGKWIVCALVFITFALLGLLLKSTFVIILAFMIALIFYIFETIKGVYLLGILLTLCSFFFFYRDVHQNPKIYIEMSNPQLETEFPDNYIKFSRNQRQLNEKFYEINGWLLLKNILLKKMGTPQTTKFEDILLSFENTKGIYGWWPDKYMKKGKEYIKDMPPVYLAPDLDDTAWIYKHKGVNLPAPIVERFTSDLDLPDEYLGICHELSCDEDYILRVWGTRGWSEDIDIVVIANALTSIEPTNPFLNKVIEENTRLINHIIENYNFSDYFKYFEPKVSGVALLLFYDSEFQPYLSNASRQILIDYLKKNIQQLNDGPIVSRWGAGEDVFYGLNIVTFNDQVSSLLYEFSREYLK